MIKVLTQFIHNLSGWHQNRSLYLLPLVLSLPRKDDQERMISWPYRNEDLWLVLPIDIFSAILRWPRWRSGITKAWSWLLFCLSCFWLRLVRIDGFSSLTSQSLTLPDIDRKLIMNLHASATIYLLIIDPIEDLQLLILLPRLIAMMSSWSCFLNPLFFTEEWSSCCSWSSFRWYLFAGGKIGIFSSCLNPAHHFNQNGIHRNLVARFNRSAYGSLLFIHHHFKTWLYIVNKWHCNI